MRTEYPDFPCPKCKRVLPAVGDYSVDNSEWLPVYSCPECIMVVDILGERVEMPFSFSVNEKGEPFDPGSPDGKLMLD